MSQRLGRAAEDEFKLQCSTVGITCNPSQEDDHGWDFIVEIPASASAETPYDQAPATKAALVQVKCTGGARRRGSMKVSNALELAKRVEPCLLVLYHEAVPGDRRIFARLFGEGDIARALKRGRELFVKGKRTHKATITFGFAECEERTYEGLVPWLVESVRELPDSYGSDKQKLVASVGYGNRNRRAKFTFDENGLEALVDLELGIRNQLSVSRFTLFDDRFGIALPEPVKDVIGPGVFKMKPEREVECTVTLKTKDDLLAIPSTVRTSEVSARAGQDKKALVNELFALVVSSDGVEFRTLASWTTNLGLERLADFATILSWDGEEVRISVSGKDVPDLVLPPAIITQSPVLNRDMVNAFAALNTVGKKGAGGGVRLSLEQVMSAFGELIVFGGTLGTADARLDTVASGSHPLEGGFTNLLGFIDVEVGDYTFLALFDAAVETRFVDEGQRIVELGPRNIRDCVVGKGREAIRAQGQRIFKCCEYGPDWLAIGSINELIESSAV